MPASDADLQDALVLNLGLAVQLCVDIAAHLSTTSHQPVPTAMGETFARLAASGVIGGELAGRLRRALGFRNIAVHNDEAIDWTVVLALAGEPSADFEPFAAAVARRI